MYGVVWMMMAPPHEKKKKKKIKSKGTFPAMFQKYEIILQDVYSSVTPIISLVGKWYHTHSLGRESVDSERKPLWYGAPEGNDVFIPRWVNNYPLLVQTKTTMTVSTLGRCSVSRLHFRLRHSARPFALFHLEDDF